MSPAIRAYIHIEDAALAGAAVVLPKGAGRSARLLARRWAEDAGRQLRGLGAACDPLITTDLVGVRVQVMADRSDMLHQRLTAWSPPVDSDPDLLGRTMTPDRPSTGSVQGRMIDLLRHHLFPTVTRSPAGQGAPTGPHPTLLAFAGSGFPDTVCPSDALRPPEVLCSPDAPHPPGFTSTADVHLPGRGTAPRGLHRMVIAGQHRAWYLFGLPGLTLGDPGKPALHVLCEILGGQAGLLDQRLRIGLGHTYSVTVFSREFVDHGYIAGMVSAAPAVVEQIRMEVRAMLSRVADAPLSTAAVSRAAADLAVRHLRCARQADESAVRACAYLAAGLRPPQAPQAVRQLRSIRPEHVCDTARRVLDRSDPVELLLLPHSGGPDSGMTSGPPE